MRTADTSGMLTALGLLAALLAPGVLLVWSRNGALRDPGSDPSEAWFTYAQRAQWTMLAGVLGGPLLWSATGAGAAWATWLAAHALPVIPGVTLVIIVPAMALLACGGLVTHEVAQRLRAIETPRRTARRDALVLFAGVVVPVLSLAIAAEGLRNGSLLVALLTAVAGLAVGAFIVGRARRSDPMTPHAITSGPLRDRVFALAARARVTLRQLYVVPLGTLRTANAFAVQGNQVILSDFLLDHLDDDEVDAVLAHELAHLRLGHPAKLLWSLVAVMMLALLVAPRLGLPGGLLLAVMAGLPAFFAVSRHFEYAADRTALTLGARPESLISGLIRIHRLNHIPLRWSRSREWLLTHPSTERRVLAIARRAGLSLEHVATLTAAALQMAPRPRRVPAESRPLDKLFSSPYKTVFLQRLGLSALGLTAALPIIMLILARSGLIHLPRPLLLATAALVTAVACAVLMNFAAAASYWSLRASLRSRLRASGLLNDPGAAQFVGLAPDAAPRAYEGFGVWDIGFLILTPERIDYAGEETRFSLATADVTDIALAPGSPSWIAVPRVCIRWQRADGSAGLFCVTSGESGTLLGIAIATRRLHASLRAWHAARPVGEHAPAALVFPPPAITDVTSTPLEAVLTPGTLLSSVILQSVMCAVVLVVLGMPWFAPNAPGLLDALGAAVAGHWLWMLPLMRARSSAPAQSADASPADRRAA